MSPEPRRWLDGLLGACLGVLVAALALYVAVELLKDIWPELLFVGLCVVGIAGLVGWWRSRW